MSWAKINSKNKKNLQCIFWDWKRSLYGVEEKKKNIAFLSAFVYDFNIGFI